MKLELELQLRVMLVSGCIDEQIRASNVPLMHIKVAANTPQPITSETVDASHLHLKGYVAQGTLHFHVAHDTLHVSRCSLPAVRCLASKFVKY